MNPLPEQEIIKKYLDGASTKELAFEYATNVSAIYTLMHKNRVKLRRGFLGDKHKKRTHMTYADYVEDSFIKYCKQRIKNKRHLKYFGLPLNLR